MAGTAKHAIFIGYRREDSQDTAGRIYDRLVAAFGEPDVFKDVDNLPIGTDFGDYILGLLPQCRVFLALIGPGWLDARDASGARRIDNPADWVRIEIETALKTPGLQVVPVLVNGARMPREDELPESLRRLARFNAAVVRRDPDFHVDMTRIVAALKDRVAPAVALPNVIENTKLPKRMGVGLPAAAVGAAIVLAGVWYVLEAGMFGARREAEWVASEKTPAKTAPAAVPAPQKAVTPPARLLPAAPRSDAVSQSEMVRIPGQNFEVGRYEVTFAQWDACVAAGGCNGYRPYDNGWGRGDRPVINVSWEDAKAYVQWLSERTGKWYRLPTSAEWEIAARAGSTTHFWWGDQDPVCDRGASNGAQSPNCAPRQTVPVGLFQPNGFGLYDVHGNVWEWVEDEVPADRSSRVLRGGSWDDDPRLLRSAYRDRVNPTVRLSSFGFRLARTL